MPAFSVVVSTKHRPVQLEHCLASLSRLDNPSHEVLVVDNASNGRDGAAAARVAAKMGARYAREPRPGLSRARNLGLQEAEGEFIAFLDDDAIAEQSWLSKHEAAFTDSAIMATTGRILPITAHSSPAARLLDVGEAPLRVNRETPEWFELANFGGLGFGSNIVVRRGLLEAGFRFRESLGAGTPLAGGEELYALFKIIQAGHAVAYVPDAVVRHDGLAGLADPKAQEIAGTQRYSAYLCLLLAEEPAYRRRTARHILGSLRQARRPWRKVSRRELTASRGALFLAACKGPWMYLRSRLEGRRAPR